MDRIWFLTNTCYGQWLPGDDRGFVGYVFNHQDPQESKTIHSLPGRPYLSKMRGLEHGYKRFKFFPAESSGGVAALKGFAGPFSQVNFCPTGGIDAAKAPSYLALPNVITVGGSWMVPGDALTARDWTRIGALAAAAVALRR